ncbi:MAG: hypothetical protein EOM73_03320, partial [Bacteroidia bacterium]|nr:hypothetical protein [Bacteroidia bacterium]
MRDWKFNHIDFSTYPVYEGSDLGVFWMPEKTLVTAAQRSYYVPVGYIAPLEGNRPAVGYDINSDPVRRVAIDQAIMTGRPAVTEPIRLVQEQQQRIGVLVLHPAYRGYQGPEKGAPPQLIGFAVGVIKVDELVEIAIRDQLPEGLVVRLSDPQAGADRQRLYHSPGSAETDMIGSAERFSWSTGLMMADRSWILQVYPTSDYLREHRSWFAWGIGVAGLLFSALLQMMMLAMSGRTFAVQQQVERQTEALVQAKQQLE